MMILRNLVLENFQIHQMVEISKSFVKDSKTKWI